MLLVFVVIIEERANVIIIFESKGTVNPLGKFGYTVGKYLLIILGICLYIW